MRSTPVAVILALATVTALAGCVDQGTTPDPTSTSGQPGSPAPTNHEDPYDDGEVVPPDEAGGDSQAAAIEAATTALSTFAQPNLDYDTWWSQMLPLLTQQAGVAYEGTDPAEIPVHQVTGAGVVLEGSTEVSLIVQLPTDAGPYNVTLTRPSAGAPWLADRIRPANA